MSNYIKESDINLVLGEVVSLIIEDDKAKGIVLADGTKMESDAVIIASGTFLRAKTMKGTDLKDEGPDGKPTTFGISEQLEEYGIELIRLKTGTPPRLQFDSIDFSVLEEEPGADELTYFTEDTEVKKEYQNVPA